MDQIRTPAALVVLALAVSLLLVAPLRAAEPDAKFVPPIRSVDPYVPVPGARHADSKRVYRVVFDARHGADQPEQLVPAVNMAGSEINTFAAHQVLRRNLRLAIVFHTAPADDGLLDDAHYRAKYGRDNPNLKVLAELRIAGAELYVCGQELIADKVPFDAISPDVTIVEDGLVALMEFENDGYAHLSF